MTHWHNEPEPENRKCHGCGKSTPYFEAIAYMVSAGMTDYMFCKKCGPKVRLLVSSYKAPLFDIEVKE